MTLAGSSGTVTFKYDPFGRRIYKSSSSGTSVFAYDGDNLIEETNASGAVVARYPQGLNIDEPLAMLRSSATSFFNADGLGSITSLTNAAGSLAQTYTFDSFGKQTASVWLTGVGAKRLSLLDVQCDPADLFIEVDHVLDVERHALRLTRRRSNLAIYVQDRVESSR
jgi:hypothetical protein